MIKCRNECLLNKFDGCCYSCPEFDSCTQSCSDHPDSCGESTFDEESGLTEFKTSQVEVIQGIVNAVKLKKQIEAKEKKLKDKLKEAMERYGVKKFNSDLLNIVYIPEGQRSQIDSAKLKKAYPDIAAECTKVSKTSAYVKVTVKEGE